ncbi:hypothetical protein WA158_008128 [Blastocystis sp. Blastoise]
MSEITSTSTTPQNTDEKVCLVVVEGLGLAPEGVEDAFKTASTPIYDSLVSSNDCIFTPLKANGSDVGVNNGSSGNFGIGYLCLGTGRINERNNVRINKKIQDGSFFTNETLLEALKTAKENTGRVHLFGQITDSYQECNLSQIESLLKVCKQVDVPHVFIHGILGDIDEEQQIGSKNVKAVEDMCTSIGCGKISTLAGNMYAISEPENGERIIMYYSTLTKGSGNFSSDLPHVAIENIYKKGEQDETFAPLVFDINGTVQNNDVVINFNNKGDAGGSINELLYSAPNGQFSDGRPMGFTESIKLSLPSYMHDQHQQYPYIYIIYNIYILCEEKRYNMAWFIFNGAMSEEAPTGITTIKVSSLEDMKDDKCAALSMNCIGNLSKTILSSNSYSLAIFNLSAPGVYSQNNDFEQLKLSIESTDKVLGTIKQNCEENGYRLVVVSTDCGSSTVNKDNSQAEICYDVPLIITKKEGEQLEWTKPIEERRLANVSSTILKLLNISKPESMEDSLI